MKNSWASAASIVCCANNLSVIGLRTEDLAYCLHIVMESRLVDLYS
jgi:hypothetical protein